MTSTSDEGFVSAECATVTVTAVAMAMALYKIIMAPTMNDLMDNPFDWLLGWVL